MARGCDRLMLHFENLLTSLTYITYLHHLLHHLLLHHLLLHHLLLHHLLHHLLLHHLPTSLTTSLTSLTYITYLLCYNLSSNYITREIEAVNDPFYRHKIRSLTQKVKITTLDIPKRKFESSSLPRPRLVVYLVPCQNCII